MCEIFPRLSCFGLKIHSTIVPGDFQSFDTSAGHAEHLGSLSPNDEKVHHVISIGLLLAATSRL